MFNRKIEMKVYHLVLCIGLCTTAGTYHGVDIMRGFSQNQGSQQYYTIKKNPKKYVVERIREGGEVETDEWIQYNIYLNGRPISNKLSKDDITINDAIERIQELEAKEEKGELHFGNFDFNEGFERLDILVTKEE